MAKLTTLLILISFMQISAKVYSQSGKLDLNVKDRSILEIFEEIENNSKYLFFYDNDQVDLSNKVSINIKQEELATILKELLKGTDLTYQIKNRLILVQSKNPIQNTIVQSQQKSISGTVTDTSGQPLPGVTVIVKGTMQGTVTNADGEYSLADVPNDATLVFSFVGMKTQEIEVGYKTSINVTMEADAIGIEEVVAIGYGVQKKMNVTGSVASIGSEKLTVAPVSNVTNSLGGRLPGLVSKQESGAPGQDNATLSIRGFGDALVIVDGVESSFNNINTNEIESISVLKDASAAIYGSRAGNGVILVTTKRGNDSKPIITLNSSYSLQGFTKLYEPASSGQWTEMQREAWLNAGKPEDSAPFTQEEIDLYYSGTDPDYPNSNWQKKILRPWAPMQDNNISVRGGSDKIKYYGFLGYLDQKTNIKLNGGGYKRYNLRSNLDAKILDNLTMHINLSSIVDAKRYSYRGVGREVWFDIYRARPIYATELPDPNKVPWSGSGGTALAAATNREIGGYQNIDNQDIQGSLSLDYDFKFIKGLSAKVFFNYSKTFYEYKYYDKPVKSYTYNYKEDTYTQRAFLNKSRLYQNINTYKNTTRQFSLKYDRILNEDHHLTVLALYEAIDYLDTYLGASRQTFLSTSIDYLFGGSSATAQNSGSASEMGRASYVGRLNYSFKSKYLLESTIRYDASAKFPSDSRWGFFPSVSLGWRLSEEGFIKNNLSSLDNLKLRGSYSKVGNDDIGNFQYLTGYTYSTGYVIGDELQKGLTDQGIANPLLTWEKINIYNVGADFSMWKRKLYGEFDAFYRQRNGILADRIESVPTTFGATLPTENLNSQTDRGFELMIGNSGSLKDFTWDVSANISWNRTKWEHYEEPNYTDPDDIRINKNSGKWVDRVYGYLSDGLFTSQSEIDNLGYDQDRQGNTTLRPGDIKYIDLNGDKIIDWRDQTEIGKGSFPHWMFGINNSFSYKNFDCSMLFSGAFGYTAYFDLGPQADYLFDSATLKFFYDLRWTEENNNPNAFIPRLGGSSMNKLTSDHRIKDIFYMRLKTLSVGYNLPNSVIKKLNIQNLRFYFAATNLFTLSSARKFGYEIDPEAPTGNIQFYPQMRTLSLGLNLSL